MTLPTTQPPDEPTLPGDSQEQRDAERLLVQGVADALGVNLSKQRRKTVGGSLVEFDGLSDNPPVVVEAWPTRDHRVPLRSTR